MNQDQRERFKELVNRLRGDMSLREFSDLAKIPFGTVSSWDKSVGSKSKEHIRAYVSSEVGKRELQDLEDYLTGRIDLDLFLDPQHKLKETLNQFSLQKVRVWIKNRTNLNEKITLLNDLVEQVGGVAIANSSLRLSQSIQSLLDSGRFASIEQIAEHTGIKQDRLRLLYKGEALPCEDEVMALSPLLPEDIKELRRVYVTGELEPEPPPSI